MLKTPQPHEDLHGNTSATNILHENTSAINILMRIGLLILKFSLTYLTVAYLAYSFQLSTAEEFLYVDNLYMGPLSLLSLSEWASMSYPLNQDQGKA